MQQTAETSKKSIVFKAKDETGQTKSKPLSLNFVEFKNLTSRQDTCKFYVEEQHNKVIFSKTEQVYFI